ncbi:MAG: hypothetical protein IJZ76_06125 [Lachnospiraceae bacterium]|nr:hypothetical protein [Lachnospiraceae bacterium]
MRKEDLFQAIGEIDDTLIAKSGKRAKRKNKAMFRTVLATAACLAVLFGATFAANQAGLLKPVQPSTEQTQPGSHGIPGTPGEDVGTGLDDPDVPYIGPSIIDGGCDGDEEIDIEYTRGMVANEYEAFVEFNPGPLMPVTLAQANSSVTAQRDMTYDFSNVTKKSDGFVAIRDSYEFTNSSDEDQTVTLLYPYQGTIYEMNNGSKPEVTVNGEKVSADMQTGAYYGKDSCGYEQLLSFAHSTDEMDCIIGDVASHADAKSVDEELWNKNVLVYEFSDVKCVGDPTEYGAYVAKFKVDDYKNVYFQDIGGVTYYEGYLYVGFYVEDVMNGDTPKIIFLNGKEPTDYSEQGYSCMEFFEQYEVDGISASMTKREMTFGKVFEEVMESNRVAEQWGEERELSAQEQQLFEGFAAQIVSDVVARNAKDGEYDDMSAYFSNSLSDMAYYAYTGTTLFLVKNEVTIPAGESIRVEYEYLKQGMHELTCPEPNFFDCYGYDNAINMGTNMTFTKQVANIAEKGNIEIVDQNYQFDLEAGVKSVELALDAERYYMIVRVLE